MYNQFYQLNATVFLVDFTTAVTTVYVRLRETIVHFRINLYSQSFQ